MSKQETLSHLFELIAAVARAKSGLNQTGKDIKADPQWVDGLGQSELESLEPEAETMLNQAVIELKVFLTDVAGFTTLVDAILALTMMLPDTSTISGEEALQILRTIHFELGEDEV